MNAWVVPRQWSWKQKALLVACTILLFFLFQLVAGGKVYADGASAPYAASTGCGVGTTSHGSYAGLLAEVYWFDSGGGLHVDNGSSVRVWTDDGRPDGDPGNIVWLNSSNRFSSSYPHGDDMTFNQYDSGCGDGHNVVLGYTNTSTRSDGYGPRWALDCDASQYGLGSERWFHATGVGVPAGARAGGTWEVKTFQAINGYTRTVTLAYQEPPPPNPSPIGVFDALDCTLAQGWAFDPSRSSQSIRVDVQVDGDTKIWRATDVYRPDVNAAYGISGNHGFSDDISAWVSDGGYHTVEPFAIDVDSSGNTTGSIVSLGRRAVSGCLKYTLTPSVSSPAGAYIEAGDALNFVYQVKNTGPTASPVVANAIKQYVVPVGQSLKTYTMQDNITANCNNAFSSTICASSWQLPNRAFPVGTTSVTTAGSSPAYTPLSTSGLPVGTSICQILAVDPASQSIRGRWSAPSCVTVVAKPYFTVTGGDISSNGNITSWNVNNVAGAGYAGAGSQLAALATGNISSFVSGTGMGAIPTALAFANTTASGTKYGGGYTSSITIPTVSTSGATALPATPTLSSLNGVYTRAGDITLSGPVPAGKNVTIVVSSGDLYISSNIAYSYGSLAQIPRLTVIVQNGNIYVDNDVTEIHGVFYIGGNGANGNFYSCATSNGVVTTDYATCNHPLTVYGAVTANKLVLSRTYGSVHASTGTLATPAENFFYSPEVWLAKPYSTAGSSSTIYNSYVSLPPIL